MTHEVLNYSHDPMRVFRGFKHMDDEDKSVQMYGIELETAVKGSTSYRDAKNDLSRRYIQETVPEFMIFKSDGSIPPGGYEMVTVPASYRYHVKMWTKFFDADCAKDLTSWGTEKCGIHIHVGRETLTPLMQSKLNLFFNAPKNQAFIFHLAGRTATQMQQWCSPKSRVSSVDWLNDPQYYGDQAKYRALNTGKGPTLEIRIFRGNVKRGGFMKNLDFADAIVNFSKRGGLNHMTAEAFCHFVEKQPGQWPALQGWMMANGYIGLDGTRTTEELELIYDGGL